MIDIQMPNKDLYTNNLTLRWFKTLMYTLQNVDLQNWGPQHL